MVFYNSSERDDTVANPPLIQENLDECKVDQQVDDEARSPSSSFFLRHHQKRMMAGAMIFTLMMVAVAVRINYSKMHEGGVVTSRIKNSDNTDEIMASSSHADTRMTKMNSNVVVIETLATETHDDRAVTVPRKLIAAAPTFKPTKKPPTRKPTKAPISKPPTRSPTNKPTRNPTNFPTSNPTNSGPTPIQFVRGDLAVTVDSLGIKICTGMSVKVLARAGQKVPLASGGTSSINFHSQPDAAGVVPLSTGGYVYVSNSELSSAAGGVYGLYFDSSGNVSSFTKFLGGTSRNCGGGLTPWKTWITCEEFGTGQCWQIGM